MGLDWQQILLHVFNLIILVVGLSLLLFKPVRGFMRAREEKYKKSAEEHAKRTDEIKELDAERERKIKSLDKELAEHRKAALGGVEKERKKLLADAQAEADAIVSAGRRRTKKEREAAFAGAREELSDIVVRSAEKLLAIDSSPESDRALYDSYLKVAGGDITPGKATREEREKVRKSAEQSNRKESEARARAELAYLAAEAAESAIKRESTPDGDKALYDEFLMAVNGSGTNG